MQTFATPAAIAAVLDIPAGRIQIIAADRAETTVDIRPADATKNRDVTAAERIRVGYADGILTIEAAKPDSAIRGSAGYAEVTVQLPAGSRVEATAASTEFRGVGRLGDVTVESANGSVKLDEAATARLALQMGDITVGRLGGDAQLTTQKGDLTVAEAATGAVTLRTQHGNITVGATGSATLDAGTTFGRVHNALRGGDDLTIHATTSHGDITARSL